MTVLLLLPLLALAVLGVVLVRSAVTHRKGNWIAGAILGGVFALLGSGGMIGLLFSRP